MNSMHLTRELIVNSAVTILDSYGLADMTMRRVATQLSVAPGALYWHVANKQELIGAIAGRILAPVLPTDDDTNADDTNADEDILSYCRQLRAALLHHRDGAELVASALAQPDSPLRDAVEDQLIRLVAQSTSSPGASRTAARALLHLLLGACVQHQARRQYAERVEGAQRSSISDEVADIDSQVELVLAGLSGTGPARS